MVLVFGLFGCSDAVGKSAKQDIASNIPKKSRGYKSPFGYSMSRQGKPKNDICISIESAKIPIDVDSPVSQIEHIDILLKRTKGFNQMSDKFDINDRITPLWICKFVCACLRSRVAKLVEPSTHARLDDRVQVPSKLIVKILDQAHASYKTLPSLIRLGSDRDAVLAKKRSDTSSQHLITIFGDVHGQFVDTLNALIDCGIFRVIDKDTDSCALNPLKTCIGGDIGPSYPLILVDESDRPSLLFNGDIVDRGDMSLEVLLLISALRIISPKKVHINRGNHEDAAVNALYGFKSFVQAAYPDISESSNILSAANRLFQSLPLATLLYDQIIVLHGGLPRYSNVTLDTIEKLPRTEFRIDSPKKALIFNMTVMSDILWSDPLPDPKSVKGKRIRNIQNLDSSVLYLNNSNRGSIYFTETLSLDFLSRNNLSLLVRSHEVACEGYELNHQNHVVTLFSAPFYMGRIDNHGALMHIDQVLCDNIGTSESASMLDLLPNMGTNVESRLSLRIQRFLTRNKPGPKSTSLFQTCSTLEH
jgi:hypothetical protein